MIVSKHDLLFTGQCPGGTYIDDQGKEKKCPQKSVELSLSSLKHILSTNNPDIAYYDDINIYKCIIPCTRCGSPIQLTPVAGNVKDIYIINEIKE
jgi:hypothetical protein